MMLLPTFSLLIMWVRTAFLPSTGGIQMGICRAAKHTVRCNSLSQRIHFFFTCSRFIPAADKEPREPAVYTGEGQVASLEILGLKFSWGSRTADSFQELLSLVRHLSPRVNVLWGLFFFLMNFLLLQEGEKQTSPTSFYLHTVVEILEETSILQFGEFCQTGL